jgi:hypothetical protein
MPIAPENFHRWLNTLLLGACGILLGILWHGLQDQIGGLSSQINDQRLDIRVLQVQNTELKGVNESLKQRITDLVAALNDRPRR